AEARRDLRLVLGRRAAVRLAIRLGRRLQLTRADAHAREVSPRLVGGRVVAQPADRLPRRRGLALVVEAIQRVAVAEECGAGDRRVGVPNDAAEVDQRLL